MLVLELGLQYDVILGASKTSSKLEVLDLMVPGVSLVGITRTRAYFLSIEETA